MEFLKNQTSLGAFLFITKAYQCTETRSMLRQLYLTTKIIHQFKADPARKSGNAMQIESAYKSMFKEAMFCKFKYKTLTVDM